MLDEVPSGWLRDVRQQLVVHLCQLGVVEGLREHAVGLRADELAFRVLQPPVEGQVRDAQDVRDPAVIPFAESIDLCPDARILRNGVV